MEVQLHSVSVLIDDLHNTDRYVHVEYCFRPCTVTDVPGPNFESRIWLVGGIFSRNIINFESRNKCVDYTPFTR